MARAQGEMGEAQFQVLLLLPLLWVAPGKVGMTLWEGRPPDTQEGSAGMSG